MSVPAIFVFIQNGQKQYFYDRWAAPFFFRELLWGPNALYDWLTDEQELEGFTDDISAGVVVDFDLNRMVWFAEDEVLPIPRLESAIDRMFAANWPGFDVVYGFRGEADLAAAAHEDDADEYESFDPLEERPEFLELAGHVDPEQNALMNLAGDAELEDLDLQIQSDEPRAWVTLIDRGGSVGHRHVKELSQDLFLNRGNVLTRLDASLGDDIPDENVCTEGIWFDQSNNEIGIWGTRATQSLLDDLVNSWPGWNVRWHADGYSDQCAASGPMGKPMSDIEAIGRVMPILLSTERMDMGTVFRSLGGQLKQSGTRVAGCLVVVLSIPPMVFAAFTGNWKAAGMAIGIITLGVAIIFKLLERSVRKKFESFEQAKRIQDGDVDRPAVPGPLDEQERRAAMDAILGKAGLPSLAAIEEAKIS